MSDIITTADLASYLRQPDADDAALVVELTNGLIVEVVGNQETYPTRVRAVALEVAARAYRNPGGYSSETIDDYTYRRDETTRNAGVYLTAAERDMLLVSESSPRVKVGWLL